MKTTDFCPQKVILASLSQQQPRASPGVLFCPFVRFIGPASAKIFVFLPGQEYFDG